jgi:hypothetical protein
VSANNCNWDYAIADLGGVTLTGAGGGVVTQGAVDIGYGDYSQAGWTWTGVVTNTQTCSGNFNHTSGTITTSVLRLVLNGVGKTHTSVATLSGLKISGSITVAASFSIQGSSATHSIVVDSGKTLSINIGLILEVRYYNTGCTFTNNGSISGAGTLRISTYDADRAISLGDVSCPVAIYANSAATANRIVTLGANTTLGSTLTMTSAHATNAVTLATSTYTLQCTTLTLDTRGCLSQTGTGGNVIVTGFVQSGVGSVLTGKVDANFYCSGDFTQTAGAITNLTLKLTMMGDEKTLNFTDASNYIYDLTCNGNTIVTNTASTDIRVANNIIIAAGKCVKIANGKYLTHLLFYSGSTLYNRGIIAGLGTFRLSPLNGTVAQYIGIIQCYLRVEGSNSLAASSSVLMGSEVRSNSLVCMSNHASRNCTLNLNGHRLDCTSFTVGTRGIADISNSTLKCNVLDTSAGALTVNANSKVIMNGAASSIKLAAGHKLQDLICEASAASLKLLANLTVDGIFAHVNPIDLNGFALTLTRPEEEYTGLRRPTVKARCPATGLGIADQWLADLEGIR